MARIARSLAVASVLTAAVLPSAGAADRMTVQASRPESSYPRCSAMHRKYPTGIARDAKARARSVKNGHAPPLVNRTVYLANAGLDRDHDGVACEIAG